MNGPSKYRLNASLTIERLYWVGQLDSAGNPMGEHGHWGSTTERLQINSDIDLGALDFLGAMGVMTHMHEAIQTITGSEKK